MLLDDEEAQTGIHGQWPGYPGASTMTGPRERALGKRRHGWATAPFYPNRLEVKAVNLHPNPLARAIRQTKSAPKLARDKRPLRS